MITSRNKKIFGMEIRKSRRLDKQGLFIPTKELGNSSRPVSNIELERFVSVEIDDQLPQIISIPLPPERHAFLLHVQKEKIMVSDWGGSKQKMNEHYSQFMKSVENKYGLPIEYFDIDTILYKEADEHHKRFSSSGGCSYYIYEWVKRNYSGYCA
jgi:hypothetical protein